MTEEEIKELNKIHDELEPTFEYTLSELDELKQQVRAEVIEKIVKKTTIYIDDMKRFYEESQDSSFLCAIAEAQKIRRIIWGLKEQKGK